MKHTQTLGRAITTFVSSVIVLTSFSGLEAAPAPVLFQDDFSTGIPGWTAVQPTGGNYLDGPMLWEFDKSTDSFSEQSNLYTDGAGFSVSRIATMLINDTVTPANFTYTARLTAGDDDGFGLIWGFQDEYTFYRAYFGRQARTGWPFLGAGVDRLNNGQITDLFGSGAGSGSGFINTANRPFDVTITVNAGLLTLTVVDDPLGAATPYNLVTAAPLPTSGAGKVGIFSWGMAGGNPRSFRVQNPVLSPTPLVGNPSATVLTNWSFLITPRGSDGTVPVIANSPVWANGLGVNGNRGTMIENSDWTTDNLAAFTTNFAAPSAVAGDVNWSNYVYTARIISSDDDGFGMLLRYQNQTNFYRIAFRRQAPPANGISLGIKSGISIQKNVNLVFEEIFASAGFLPPIGVPIDVNASIRDNRLQIVIISNPLSSAAQSFFFGPFDITGGTVNTGKIGIFSWAQNSGGTTSDAGTEVDFVKVQEVNGEGLLVSSAFAAPTPPSGLNDFPVSTIITSSVPSLVQSQPGVRRVSTGWSGVGAVPASGTTNQITFTLSTFSSIIWNWRTEYLLSTTASVGGTVVTSAGPWISEGTNVTITAQTNAGYIFVGWSGDTISTRTNLIFAMNRPISLTANFAVDSDGDNLADSWEMQYFTNLTQTAAGDADTDGTSNLDEFRRGSNPTSAETLVASDGLSSQWVNTQRDPLLPGQLFVTDFGSGYRGASDNSNDNRFGNDAGFVTDTNLLANGASFQSPIVVVRSNLWQNAWGSNFVAQIELTVGDNDGNCFYFRYKDELNWYRATLCGEDTADLGRPRLGLSIQRRVNGKYADVPFVPVSGDSFVAITDPLDGTGAPGPTYAAGFKRVRLTITATNSDFEAKVIGWDFNIPGFSPSFEYITTFSDTNHTSGRIGFGFWGQGGFGAPNATNGIPIDTGGFADNILVNSGGSDVFTETWETAPLTNQFPAGWSNPLMGTVAEGNWQITAHGTFVQLANFSTPTTGTLGNPKGDGDGLILLAPAPSTTNYLLQIGFHPFDDDGIGFVYNYKDTSNYSRVLFVAEASADGRVPQGITVSRKTAGVWSDIVAGDSSFIYTNGRPFEVEFANNNGAFTLLVRDSDTFAFVSQSKWTEPAANTANRFGLACWSMQEAHFLYARALGLPNQLAAPSLRISGASISNGNFVLDVLKENIGSYNVQRKANLNDGWITIATGQTGAQYSEPVLPQGAFYQLVAP